MWRHAHTSPSHTHTHLWYALRACSLRARTTAMLALRLAGGICCMPSSRLIRLLSLRLAQGQNLPSAGGRRTLQAAPAAATAQSSARARANTQLCNNPSGPIIPFRNRGRTWLDFGRTPKLIPNLYEVRPTLVEFGQIKPKSAVLDRIRPDVGRARFNVGRIRWNFGRYHIDRFRPKSDRCWSKSLQVRSKPVRCFPNSAKRGRDRSNNCPNSAELGGNRNRFG